MFNGEKVTMFSNGEKFIIHKENEPCGLAADGAISESDSPHKNVMEFIKETYPKQKYLPLAFAIIEKHHLFDDNLFCVPFPSIHIADICSFFLNRFGKNDNTDPRYIKFCKFLQKKGIRLPKICLKNPVAQKYLCWHERFSEINKLNMTTPNDKFLIQCSSKVRFFPFTILGPEFLTSTISSPPPLFRTVFSYASSLSSLERLSATSPIWNWAIWTPIFQVPFSVSYFIQKNGCFPFVFVRVWTLFWSYPFLTSPQVLWVYSFHQQPL